MERSKWKEKKEKNNIMIGPKESLNKIKEQKSDLEQNLDPCPP